MYSDPGLQNPNGIPIWKLFDFNFWPGDATPLGPQWTLNPERYANKYSGRTKNTYLGYSIETACLKRPYINPAARLNRAWVLAKLLTFFHPSSNAWPPDYFEEAQDIAGTEFLAGIGYTEEALKHETNLERIGVPKRLIQLKLLPQDQFLDKLSYMKMLIGLGNPKEYVLLSSAL